MAAFHAPSQSAAPAVVRAQSRAPLKAAREFEGTTIQVGTGDRCDAASPSFAIVAPGSWHGPERTPYVESAAPARAAAGRIYLEGADGCRREEDGRTLSAARLCQCQCQCAVGATWQSRRNCQCHVHFKIAAHLTVYYY